MHFRWLALKKCSSSSSIFEISEIFQSFIASAGSFNVKNDHFHTFFRCLGCLLNLPALVQNKDTRSVSMETVRTVPDRERTNAQGIA